MKLEEILGQQDVLGQAMNMKADTSGMTQEQRDAAISKSRHDLFSQLGAMPVGMVEGMVGIGGDIERLGRGAFGAATADNGNRWDTFLNELGNSDTTLWNTENVQNWTDEKLDGTAFGDMLKAGGDGRLIGEILAPAPPIAGAMKYGGKALDFLDEGATFANKYLNKFDIQPGLSIKDVSKANRPGYVYKTVNTVNGKKYIGSKISPEGTKGKYFNENYYGSGTDLNKAIAKHGKENFINVKEMDTRTFDGLKKAEEGLLNRVDAGGDRSYYNRHNSYGSGGVPTEATRAKLRKAREGYVTPEATKEKIRQKAIGRKATEETKEILRNRPKRTLTDSTKEKLSAASKGNQSAKGNVLTKEQRKVISDNLRKRPTNNKSGIAGVMKRGNRYQSKITFNRNSHSKTFDTIEEATAWRESMLNKYNKGLL